MFGENCIQLYFEMIYYRLPLFVFKIVFLSPASKYCPLLIKEGGIALLEQVLELDSSHDDTKDMAR